MIKIPRFELENSWDHYSAHTLSIQVVEEYVLFQELHDMIQSGLRSLLADLLVEDLKNE